LSNYASINAIGEIRVYPSTNVKTGDIVTFNGSMEGDLPDYKYFWNFGDGGSIQGKNVTHIYKYQGNYKVTLKVRLGESQIRTENITISVEDRPENPLYVGIALTIILGLIFASLSIMVLAELKERENERKKHSQDKNIKREENNEKKDESKEKKDDDKNDKNKEKSSNK
jgi:PKD repeat protein